MYPIGLSTCDKLLNEAFFASCADAGIREVELSELDYQGFDFPGIKRTADKYGIHLWSLHLPYPIMDISSCVKEEREHAVSLCESLFHSAGSIGIDKFILHPSLEPIGDEERNDRLLFAADTLPRLASLAEREGVCLCVEDLPRTCLGNSIEEMRFLLDADDRLKMCFDTNHIFGAPPQDVIRALEDRIVTLHVSDFDYVNERHWLPGEGQIDWQEVLKALGDIGYAGVFMYEIAFECPKTILRDRELTCSDFVRNAGELFSGKTPTVFSRPKPGLGMFE